MAHRHAHQGRRRTSGGGPRRQREVLLGTIRIVRPGVATVETPEGRFPVAKGGIRQAMDGDEVHAMVVRRGGREPMVVVRDVVSRATTSFVGVYDVADPLGVVSPLDARLRRDFFVVPPDESAQRLGVRAGDVVRARILEYPARGSAGIVTIDERLGAAGELDLLVEQVVASFGLPGPFPQAALAEADGLSCDVEAVLMEDLLRRDLRDHRCVTIDPADARDFDDAVGGWRLPACDALPDGGYEVEVHIADVGWFVRWGSSLDLEARQRTCSTYLVDRVIPMLPERLCDDLCSLRPHEDRLAMSVRMTLDATGELRESEAFPSAIRSSARLDYDTADGVLAGDGEALATLAEATGPDAAMSPADVAEMLHVLDEVARARRELRRRRGSVDFETREAHVVLDEDGHPTGVTVRARTAATSLVEEAMLLANESVARMLADVEMPAAFRTHEPPAPDDLKAVVPVLSELGVLEPGDAPALIAGSPQALQSALAAARGTSAEALVSALLLRAQRRALYQPENLGHYALGARAYCHFTSPIRRYPDLVVHRALRALLAGTRDSHEQREVARRLPQICRDCSDRERTADAADRMSHKVKMAELFSERVGREYVGVVMGCERFGLFVTLDESCAEGLVPTRELGEEWFVYDEARMTLTGESTGRVWRVGQPVRVRVTRTDPARGQIDFALA